VSGLVVLSDVRLGYGSPQVVRLAATLSKLLGEPACIIAPKGDAAAGALTKDAGVDLLEIAASAPFGDVRHDIEFCLQAAREVDRLSPRWLVLCAFLGAPALLRMRHRPERCLYFGYEHTDGRMGWIERVFAGLADRFDLAIYPEEHRAALDAPRLGLQSTPTLVMLNSVIPLASPTPAEARNGRIVYGGLIDPKRTHGDALLCGGFDEILMDVFGRLEGFSEPNAVLADLAQRAGNVRYHGQQPVNAAYHAAIAQASAALVAWSPQSESTFFACPNKFFEAIALGVPPVTAPHPQAARIVRQFGCGWVADGFETADLRTSLDAARAVFGTQAHADMIGACLGKAQPHLSWEAQALKLEQALSALR
jgi:hypothetical protein